MNPACDQPECPPLIGAHVHFWRAVQFGGYASPNRLLHRDFQPADLSPQIKAAGSRAALAGGTAARVYGL